MRSVLLGNGRIRAVNWLIHQRKLPSRGGRGMEDALCR